MFAYVERAGPPLQRWIRSGFVVRLAPKASALHGRLCVERHSDATRSHVTILPKTSWFRLFGNGCASPVSKPVDRCSTNTKRQFFSYSQKGDSMKVPYVNTDKVQESVADVALRLWPRSICLLGIGRRSSVINLFHSRRSTSTLRHMLSRTNNRGTTPLSPCKLHHRGVENMGRPIAALRTLSRCAE